MHQTLILFLSAFGLAQGEPPPKPLRKPLHRVIDLNVGESQEVELSNGKKVSVKLLDLQETREEICSALTRARVKVEVAGQDLWITAATYHLPVTVGDVQIDCSITKGCSTNCTADFWNLVKDARFRIWPAGSPYLEPGTFVYPLRQRWFAGDTWIANEPVLPNVPKAKIYYHSGLDLGGSEGRVDVLSTVDGQVIVAGREILPGNEDLAKRLQNRLSTSEVYILDDRGWYHWYAHLKTIDIHAGEHVKMGQKIGLLGKEGGSGGWSHLHFEIKSRQPSGEWGTENGYPFIWEAYRRQYAPPLLAVAGPLHHQLLPAGGKVALDGLHSRSSSGEIVRYEWTFSDGGSATGPSVTRTYGKVGTYSEALKVTDSQGNVDYDFVIVYVIDPGAPKDLPPRLNANYAPTLGIQPGDPVTFKVRAWNTREGQETWDFGDGSPPATVKTDGSLPAHAPNGYAETTHRYEKPGHYLVRVERTDPPGVKAVTHLHVRVGDKGR